MLIFSAAFGLSAAIGVSAAVAADMSVPSRVYTKAPVMVDPATNWSGFYAGAHVGGLLGRSRVVDDGVLTESGAATDGVVGGFLTGYNWQTGPLVLGIEGDFGFSNARGHGEEGAPPPPPPPAPLLDGPPVLPSAPNTYNLRWDSHLVGKAGFASGQWLLFATGGLAIGGFDFQEGVPPGAPAPNRLSATMVGFSVGAGVEYAFTHHLLGRLQYVYDDFGNKSFAGVDGGTYNIGVTSQTVRTALAWKF